MYRLRLTYKNSEGHFNYIEETDENKHDLIKLGSVLLVGRHNSNSDYNTEFYNELVEVSLTNDSNKYITEELTAELLSAVIGRALKRSKPVAPRL